MEFSGRQGVKVKPYLRLNKKHLDQLHKTSMELLINPGIEVTHQEAVDLFDKAGAAVKKADSSRDAWVVKIPEKLVLQALESTPNTVLY